MKDLSLLLARILLAQLFLLAGLGKLHDYAGTQAYMASMGVNTQLLPLVIALELGGGLAIVLGWFTMPASLALGVFSVVAALMFHKNTADQMQMIMLLKDFSIAGGFLVLAAHGPGDWSVDNWSSRPASTD